MRGSDIQSEKKANSEPYQITTLTFIQQLNSSVT